MNHTFASQVKSQLEEAGFSFFKCEDKYWNFAEGENILSFNKSLGDLLRSLAKEFGI